MRLSSGVSNVLSEAASWLIAAGLGVVTIIWFDEFKTGMRYALGLSLPGPSALAETAPERPPGGMVEIRASAHGHFTATALVNGRALPVVIDTGASLVALSYEDARLVGVHVRPGDFTQRVGTANGIARVAPVVLESISLGDITLRNVEAAVSEPGRLGTSLLGMTFIGRLGRAEMRSGILTLQE